MAHIACRFEDLHVRSIQKVLRRSPQRTIDSLQPSRESATGHLSIDVRSRTRDEVDTSFACSIEEGLQSEDTFFTVFTGLALKQGPVDVEGDAVKAKGFNLVEDVEMEVWDRVSVSRLAIGDTFHQDGW
jgi:hypothetical protein